MLNILKLKGKIAENGMNMTRLAKAIGMNKDTLYRRISNEGQNLRLGDVKAICDVLHLDFDDACRIFMNL